MMRKPVNQETLVYRFVFCLNMLIGIGFCIEAVYYFYIANFRDHLHDTGYSFNLVVGFLGGLAIVGLGVKYARIKRPWSSDHAGS